MAQLVSGIRVFSADFAYTDGSIVVAIPDGWLIFEVILEISTVINGTGNVSVGYTGQATAFHPTTTAAALYRASELGQAKANGYRLGASEDGLIVVTPGSATTGAGKVYFLACPVA